MIFAIKRKTKKGKNTFLGAAKGKKIPRPASKI
jgi:hypothetical protein